MLACFISLITEQVSVFILILEQDFIFNLAHENEA